ncbi:MAG: acetamidase/formamidase family protein [Ferruginibacter sp.]
MKYTFLGVHPFLVFYFLLCLPQLIQAQNSFTGLDSSSTPGHINFTPTTFSNKFSLNVTPVLRMHPDDTVLTETIDSRGFDKNGIKRQKGGNPLTGPFYIENTSPGDVLAVTLTKVLLNRSTAFTTESFSSRSLPKSIIHKMPKPRLVNWKLDTQSGFATIDDTSYEHLHSFKVSLNPFLGCIGVAPANKKNEILSFFQGPYGGNLDFGRITQSATIYLPIFHEGSYLYMGDGHACQGDGEIAGNALETSLDIEFTVKVIKKGFINLTHPRIEDSTYLMAIGTDKSLDGALKIATSGLLEWLQTDYRITLQEATQVISTTIEYTIAEIADPEVVVVAKIKKEVLKGLKKYD